MCLEQQRVKHVRRKKRISRSQCAKEETLTLPAGDAQEQYGQVMSLEGRCTSTPSLWDMSVASQAPPTQVLSWKEKSPFS